VTGVTESDAFPTTPDALDRSRDGRADAFVTKLNATGSGLLYSTFIGGADFDRGWHVALDRRGDAYITGLTESGDFPTTPGAFDTTQNQYSDAFVAKLGTGVGPPTTLKLEPKTATNVVGTEHCVTATVTDGSGTPTPDVTVVFAISPPNETGGSDTTDEDGQASFCYMGELFGMDRITATVEPGGPSDTATKTWVLPPTSDDCKVNAEGQIRAENGDRADFEVEAEDRHGGVKGRARYADRGPAQPFTLSAKTLDALVCEGRDATIYGHAGPVTFRVEVSDRSHNGREDRFRIVTAQGYDSGDRPLVRGNVKVRG
jgi:hypothetical protein